MRFAERQRTFLEAAQAHFGTPKSVRPRELFGVSNSAKIVEGGIQLGVVNLENVKDDVEALIFACVLRFPPEDEVYFAFLIRKDKANFIERLSEMRRLGEAEKGSKPNDEASRGDDNDDAADDDGFAPGETRGDPSDLLSTENIKYRDRNNTVSIYLASDGKLWLRNKQFWNSLAADLSPYGPSTEPDEVVVALYPPTASARRSLLAREFIGWLGALVGRDKVHELAAWPNSATLNSDMRRMPTALPISEIEGAIETLGGYYPNGEIRRLHAALNFLDHKHFVILSGLSGTGKTQLALKYARAIHGLTEQSALDPLLFECPIRPEWTDPTGLTGYYDILTNRYVVPTFLEAVLVATAHRESPVFVILDEMNLAPVEYYFSDVLSALESRGPLQLHSNGVPLEGTTGGSVRAELPLPSNLYIIGTINVDETTNPVSDKVLDRASVIDMSEVDAPGFIASLAERHPDLQDSIEIAGPKLVEVHRLLTEHSQGFGYRVIEEFIRYYAFYAAYLQDESKVAIDELLVQKVLVKLRGSERQRPLLDSLEQACDQFPRALSHIRSLQNDLEEFGSFQSMR